MSLSSAVGEPIIPIMANSDPNSPNEGDLWYRLDLRQYRAMVNGVKGNLSASSITNSDGTLTISPTTGKVVASLNLANANTWTAAQQFNAGISFNAAGAKKVQFNLQNSTSYITTSTHYAGYFQSSETDGPTEFDFIPNGASTSAGFVIYNNSTLTNASLLALYSSGNNFYLNLDKQGTGASFPLNIFTGNTSLLKIDPANIFTFSDGAIINFGSTTGSQIGGSVTQKIAFHGSTPIVQPSATGSATGYSAGTTVATFHSDDTYTGNVGTTAYTINGIVANLKNLGLIAT